MKAKSDAVNVRNIGRGGVTDEYHSLDVRRLCRESLLRPGRTFTWEWLRRGRRVGSVQIRVAPDCLAILYAYDEQGQQVLVSEQIVLTRTCCRYGGTRVWFLCP